jgi:hypothetical protein
MCQKNNKIKVFLGCLLIGISLMAGCVKRSANYPNTMPNDFNFIMKIENSTYVIDTYRSTLTKTIDWETDTAISYQLTQKEKEKIFNTLKSIDIYKYPEDYAPTSTKTASPSYSYYLKFTINKKEYEISWKENTESEVEDARNFRRLFQEFKKFIEEDERVETLPKSKRAFI